MGRGRNITDTINGGADTSDEGDVFFLAHSPVELNASGSYNYKGSVAADGTIILTDLTTSTTAAQQNK